MTTTDKENIPNTEQPKSPTKKTPWGILVIISLALFIFGFTYGIKKYEQLIFSVLHTRTNLPKTDCGIVLTGAPGRVREGIALLSQGHFNRLIISGVHQHATLADMFPEILFYPEIELENVILERRSSSTAGNAQQSLAIAEALQCQDILLITSDYHLFRALKTFNLFFPPTIPITPYAIPSDRLHRRIHSWIDTRYWGIILEEWYKFLFYSVFVF